MYYPLYMNSALYRTSRLVTLIHNQKSYTRTPVHCACWYMRERLPAVRTLLWPCTSWPRSRWAGSRSARSSRLPSRCHISWTIELQYRCGNEMRWDDTTSGSTAEGREDRLICYQTDIGIRSSVGLFVVFVGIFGMVAAFSSIKAFRKV